MRAVTVIAVVLAVQVNCQFWKYPQEFLNNFSWLRQAKTANTTRVTDLPVQFSSSTASLPTVSEPLALPKNATSATVRKTEITDRASLPTSPVTTSYTTTARRQTTTTMGATATTDASTILDSTTQDVTGTTEEPRDNHRVHDFYLSKREKPQVKIAANISQVSCHDALMLLP